MEQYLRHHRIIADGAFGTYYAQKYDTLEMPELANIDYPERVKEIHLEYINAGANLIRTNTFASNTENISGDFQKVKENMEQAVSIAKEAAKESGKEIYVVGDIGPMEKRESQVYCDLVDVFVANNVSVINFETFADLDDILPAIRLAKEKNCFVMVQFCVNQYGYSSLGLSARKLIEKAYKVAEIDAVGFNCGVGPGHMEKNMGTVHFEGGKYLITLPNAGYPQRQQGKLQFTSQPEYFANKVWDMCDKYDLDIMGGCCGTTPAYIEKLVGLVQKDREKILNKTSTDEAMETQGRPKAFYLDENGQSKKKKLVAVELAPPLNAEDDQLLKAVYQLDESLVDVITFPDSPSGRTRIDSVLMAAKVKRETNISVMPHVCCRDKNAIAMRSLFLGAHINDIHNMLIMTGDPVPSLARQSTKGVFNFDAVGLMNIAKDMNEEQLSQSPIAYGGAINQGRKNLDVEIARVKRKMEAGAEFFLTQPVFCEEDALRVCRIKEETGARILCGIMPLISRRNALFMRNEIAGVSVPMELVERYPENGTKAEGEAVAVELAKEVIAMVEEFADGYYFSFPFNRVYLLDRILK